MDGHASPASTGGAGGRDPGAGVPATGPAPGVPSPTGAPGGTVLLSWDPVCQRSDSIAAETGAPLRTIHFLLYRRPWIAPLKYVLQAVATFAWLVRRRPALVVVTSPPPFAALVVRAWCALSGARYAIDAHTGIFLEPKWRPFLPLSRWLSRGAVSTIVTNDALRETVESWGGRGFVLPDPLPEIPPERERFPLDPAKVNVAAVFSFYEDEPVDEMLAVADLPEDMHVWVTGDSGRVPATKRAALSPRMTLTGFLSRASYDSLLSRCDAVVVLCTRPHTLLCGAYEAVAAHKPLVTSESAAMRRHFRKGVVWTGNSTNEIEAALREVAARRSELAREMREADGEMRADWQRTCDRLLDELARGGVARRDLPVPRWRRA